MKTAKQPILMLKKSTITKLNENTRHKREIRGITDSELTHEGGRSCRPTV